MNGPILAMTKSFNLLWRFLRTVQLKLFLKENDRTEKSLKDNAAGKRKLKKGKVLWKPAKI